VYLSEVQKTLERSTYNPDAQLSGTVLIDLTISFCTSPDARGGEKLRLKNLDEADITALDRAAPFQRCRAALLEDQ
jgi:hypothetical protein